MPFNDIMSLLMGEGGGGMTTPQFKKPRSQFDLDNKGRIKTDPITGESIKKSDRRKLSNFLKNPNLVLPGMALNMNAPMPPQLTRNLSSLSNLTGGVV